ncbi:MAG: adenosylcobinamide-phosphate synthase CbiB [Thermodesulfobacteriota bacterium]
MTPFEISIAYAADLIFGDPPGYPHPVKLIGKAIRFLENKFFPWKYSPPMQRFLGVILMLLIVMGAGSLSWLIILIFKWIHPLLSYILTVFFAYTTLATRSLFSEVKKVVNTLEHKDLIRARQEVALLVSRDTDRLDKTGIYRALIETVSENTSDGIVAPLLYLAIGGPALAMAYKALNTLDSMVGYKNERYQYFGWASAKADDLANFIPSRITAFILILSSFFLRKDWKSSWKVTWRDGRKNLSPNSGYPESAVAGALGIQLGGENFYFGVCEKKPFIGDPKNLITLDEVKESLRLMLTASLIALIITIFLTLSIR